MLSVNCVSCLVALIGFHILVLVMLYIDVTRPCRWQCFALKVKGGKYVNKEDCDNEEWLGAPGHRLGTAERE